MHHRQRRLPREARNARLPNEQRHQQVCRALSETVLNVAIGNNVVTRNHARNAVSRLRRRPRHCPAVTVRPEDKAVLDQFTELHSSGVPEDPLVARRRTSRGACRRFHHTAPIRRVGVRRSPLLRLLPAPTFACVKRVSFFASTILYVAAWVVWQQHRLLDVDVDAQLPRHASPVDGDVVTQQRRLCKHGKRSKASASPRRTTHHRTHSTIRSTPRCYLWTEPGLAKDSSQGYCYSTPPTPTPPRRHTLSSTHLRGLPGRRVVCF